MPKVNLLISYGLFVATALAPVTASADINSLLQGVVRDVTTQAITKEVARNQAKPIRTSREENRSIQKALNGLGFDAGVADGIMGNRSRKAVRDYQSANGFAATGVLTAAQKNRLLNTGGAIVPAPLIPALTDTVANGILRPDRKAPAKAGTTSTGAVVQPPSRPAGGAGNGVSKTAPAIATGAPIVGAPKSTGRSTNTQSIAQPKSNASNASTQPAAVATSRQQRMLQRQNASSGTNSPTTTTTPPRQKVRNTGTTPVQGRNCRRTRTGQPCR